MPKARDYRLTEEERQAVETAIRRDKCPEVRQRCTAIRLLHLGYKPAQVAEMQSVSISTIYAWIKHWRSGGIAALAPSRRNDLAALGPRALLAATEELARAVHGEDPETLGAAIEEREACFRCFAECVPEDPPREVRDLVQRLRTMDAKIIAAARGAQQEVQARLGAIGATRRAIRGFRPASGEPRFIERRV